MAKKKLTDNEIIDELLEAFIEEAVVEEVEQVVPEVKKVHPVVAYHKKGRTINQLAGMFMITEAEVKRILDENV